MLVPERVLVLERVLVRVLELERVLVPELALVPVPVPELALALALVLVPHKPPPSHPLAPPP